MNIHEYQAKQLLKKFGVPVLPGGVAYTADEAAKVAEGLPQGVSTPELKIEMKEGEPHAVIERLQREAKFTGSTELITIDGVRAEYADGFGLARASNTTPVIVLRFEGDTPEALARIQDAFRAELKLLAPHAHLPF